MEDKFAQKAMDWDNPEKMMMTNAFVVEMFKSVEPQSNWKAMEIGAGTGQVGMQVLPRVQAMIFEDTSEAMLGILKQKITGNDNAEVIHGEVFEYQNKDIDFIFSCMAFHHLPDIDKALNHIYKITNEKAIIVVGDIRSEDGSFHRFEPIPHKGFDTDQLSSQFKKAGFNVKSAETYNVLRRERVPGIMSEYEQFILIAEKI